jgi:dTDP-4-amino-4,6-dideoxygalactose transaminase
MNEIKHWRIDFDENQANAAYKAICNENISQGPLVKKFENLLSSYLNVPFVVATTSGSTALLMSLMAIGIKQDDEVIVPNRTWIATAHAAHILGAKVILVDVEKDRPIINAKLIESRITSKTKAIIPVHLGGRAADMKLINSIAKKNNIRVVEDAAQALGSKNKDGFLGTQSDLGCFSLSVSKIISTGQGGFIVTKNSELYNKLIAIRTHGVNDIINAKWEQIGFNFRFTDILAAIGITQLSKLKKNITKVNKIYNEYENGIKEIKDLKIIKVNVKNGEVPVYIEIIARDRDKLIAYMESKNIYCRPFYPNIDKAKYLKNKEKFIESKIYEEQGLYLPSGPGQDIENIKIVINNLRNYREKNKL